MPNTILIVDDDKEFREEFKEFLDGYEVLEASDGQEALTILRRAHTIDLLILDVQMPGLNGLEVLSEIKKTDPEMGIIILTGHSSKDVAIEALKGRADDYIEKPLDPEKTRTIIERLMEKNHPESNLDTAALHGKMERVKRFIERNCYRKTSLQDAARAVCLSPKYLSRVFKEALGENFSDFKLKIKIDKAKELLLKTGHNVNQIAEKLGYENPESFIRQFKKHTDKTPTAFRKKNSPGKLARLSKSKS